MRHVFPSFALVYLSGRHCVGFLEGAATIGGSRMLVLGETHDTVSLQHGAADTTAQQASSAWAWVRGRHTFLCGVGHKRRQYMVSITQQCGGAHLQ